MGNHHYSLLYMGQCVKLLRYGLRSSRGLVVDSCDPALRSVINQTFHSNADRILHAAGHQFGFE